MYFARPPSCRKYPRVAAENLTPHTCGYHFVSPDSLREQLRGGSAQTIPEAPAGAVFEQT